MGGLRKIQDDWTVADLDEQDVVLFKGEEGVLRPEEIDEAVQQFRRSYALQAPKRGDTGGCCKRGNVFGADTRG